MLFTEIKVINSLTGFSLFTRMDFIQVGEKALKTGNNAILIANGGI